MIADIGFLIAQNTASEIIEGIEVYPLPNSARCMAGLINLRGNVVPVFDLNVVLNTASAGTKKRLLLVLGEAEHAVGIYIEQLPQAINKSGKRIAQRAGAAPKAKFKTWIDETLTRSS